jgi:3-oxoacyl-(acyl-carrier-protein) synthase III
VVRLAGLSCYLPERRVANDEIEARVSAASRDFVMPRGLVRLLTGIEERRYAGEHETPADLAAAAAQALLGATGTDPATVDLLVFAAASQNLLEPATANIVQAALGCDRSSVFDVKNACNSFLNAVSISRAMIADGQAETVLIVAGELPSRMVKWDVAGRRELERLFAGFTVGDGGAACLLTSTGAGGSDVPRGTFRSFGRHWALSAVPAGGFPVGHELTSCHFECDSVALHEVTNAVVPDAVAAALASAGWTRDDVDVVVPHQVSQPGIREVASRCGLDPDRCITTVVELGNSAAASIPTALCLGVERGRIHPGDRVLVVGVSAGFSVAVVPLVWPETVVIRAPARSCLVEV